MEIKHFACHPPSVVKSTEKKSQTFRYDGIVNIITQLHVIKVTRISLTMVASGQTKKNSSWWWMPCNLIKSASLTEWKIQPNRRFLFFEMRKSTNFVIRGHNFTWSGMWISINWVITDNKEPKSFMTTYICNEWWTSILKRGKIKPLNRSPARLVLPLPWKEGQSHPPLILFRVQSRRLLKQDGR